jgi:CsoR family transcriptional regulator, copper-sensing transcriptional repressor
MTHDHTHHDHKATHRDDPTVQDLLKRLNRLEGQIRGIKTMVEEDVYCDDILTQVAAAKSALDAFANQLFAQHIKTCVVRDLKAGKDDIIDELMVTVKRLSR